MACKSLGVMFSEMRASCILQVDPTWGMHSWTCNKPHDFKLYRTGHGEGPFIHALISNYSNGRALSSAQINPCLMLVPLADTPCRWPVLPLSRCKATQGNPQEHRGLASYNTNQAFDWFDFLNISLSNEGKTHPGSWGSWWMWMVVSCKCKMWPMPLPLVPLSMAQSADARHLNHIQEIYCSNYCSIYTNTQQAQAWDMHSFHASRIGVTGKATPLRREYARMRYRTGCSCFLRQTPVQN